MTEGQRCTSLAVRRQKRYHGSMGAEDKDRIRVAAYVDKKMYEAMRREAFAQRVSLSKLIIYALLDYLGDDEADK